MGEGAQGARTALGVGLTAKEDGGWWSGITNYFGASSGGGSGGAVPSPAEAAESTTAPLSASRKLQKSVRRLLPAVALHARSVERQRSHKEVRKHFEPRATALPG